MVYRDQFLESLQFLKKFNKEFRRTGPAKNDLREALHNFGLEEHQEIYEATISKFLLPLAQSYLRGAEGKVDIVNNCLSISHGFWKLAHEKLAPDIAVNITIGDVSFAGERIYGLGRSKLKRIIARGAELERTLDLHAWVTLEDMSVIDLTIMATLAHRGLISVEDAKNSPVVLWKENCSSALTYHPLLVDNEFLHRVDRVKCVV